MLPKIPAPTQMCDLMPISLCSVSYKIISKILVKRLQPFLPLLVSPFQYAFVAERMILDNILLAHEVVHELLTHPESSKRYVAMKTDVKNI